MIFITKYNIFKIIHRLTGFILFTGLVLLYPEKLISFFSFELGFFRVYHLLWVISFVAFIIVLIVTPRKEISAGRISAKHFKSNKVYTPKLVKEHLNTLAKEYNKRAVYSAALWLFIVGVFLACYWIFDLSVLWIFSFTLAAAVCDAICIIFWCPFRNIIVRNKCCNTCRIKNWGYWMVCIPLIAIPSFWTYSLLVLSILIFARWEYTHYKHPERFYEDTNANLICENCTEPYGFCIYRNKTKKKR